MNTKQITESLFLQNYADSEGNILSDILLREEPSPNEMVEIIERFTQTYQQFSQNDIEIREAACVATQLCGLIRPIQKDDLFVGRMQQMPIGFTPQSKGTGLGYCIHPDIDKLLVNRPELTADNRKKLEELMVFWQEKGTVYKSRRKMPEEVMKAIPSELYYLESGIAFQLYRMGGIQLDYYKLVKLGIPGLLAEIAREKTKHTPDSKSFKLFDGMEAVLNTFSELCWLYAQQTKALATRESDADRAIELAEMTKVLENISINKPETFREGLQLVYL